MSRSRSERQKLENARLRAFSLNFARQYLASINRSRIVGDKQAVKAEWALTLSRAICAALVEYQCNDYIEPIADIRPTRLTGAVATVTRLIVTSIVIAAALYAGFVLATH